MNTMIAIKGTRFEAKAISKEKIISVWRTLTGKPFPRVRAFQLEDVDFDHMVELTKCKDDETREMVEWGRVLSTQGTDACVYNTDEFPDVDFIILVRQNPYHRLEDILKHELSHIARGDL